MSNRIKVTFSQSEKELFGCLAAVLCGKETKIPEQPLSDGCWEEILGLAQAHAVLPLLYPLVDIRCQNRSGAAWNTRASERFSRAII